jgi:hypothetical protein
MSLKGEARKNIKVRASVHKRLKIWATARDEGLEALAERLLLEGLDRLVTSGEYDDSLRAAIEHKSKKLPLEYTAVPKRKKK